MEVLLFKILGTICLWFVSLLFGYLPIRLPSFRTNKTLLSLSNCFSGGLFIAIGLIHILPEAHEALEGQWEKKNDKGEEEEVFPLSYLLCLTSFSFILLIDKIIFNSADYVEGEDEHIDLSRSVLKKSFGGSLNENFQELTSSKYKLALRLSKLNLKNKSITEDNDYEEYTRIINNDEEIHHNLTDNEINQNLHEHNEKHHHDQEHIHDHDEGDKHDHNNQSHDHQKEFDLHQKKILKYKSEGPIKEVDEEKKVFNSNFTDTEEKSNLKEVIEEENIKKEHHHHDHEEDHHGHHHKMITKEDSMLSCYVLLLAMGIHGFFAGIAFGVSGSFGESFNMFIAMIAHKWSEALTVGISFVSAEIPFEKAIKFIIFFTLITPCGVILGTYLSGMDDTIVGIAKALSAGTFIYISCAEIIIEEFALAHNKFWKFVMYCIGIVFVVFIGLLE